MKVRARAFASQQLDGRKIASASKITDAAKRPAPSRPWTTRATPESPNIAKNNWTRSSNRLQERTEEKLIGARPLLLFDFERLSEEVTGLCGTLVGRGRLGLIISNLEYGLHLGEAGEGMGACEHFDDQATE